jgi:hypothetical protein
VHAAPAAVHAFPAQHGWPAAPHWTQLPLLHASPDPVQVSGSQHGCPAPPHVTQLLFAHTTPLAVHCPLPPPLVQHAWPAPPHVPQLPAAHVAPTFGQLEPAVTHAWFTQQPPPQSFAVQQACPAPPHCAQMPAPPPPPAWHTYPVEHARPAQHAAPAPPHVEQTFALQTAPWSQTAPVQQGCPAAPHAPPAPELLVPELLAEASPAVPLVLAPPQQTTAIAPTTQSPAAQAHRVIARSSPRPRTRRFEEQRAYRAAIAAESALHRARIAARNPHEVTTPVTTRSRASPGRAIEATRRRRISTATEGAAGAP